MIKQLDLIERVKNYNPNIDEESLKKAYAFALKAHGTQERANGDPYFSHPLEVANILINMKLDTASIITGLLHDTVEDTEATLEQIKELFGDEIAKLVDGVTKLSRIELQSDQSKDAENFRKLVLAMSSDIRVLLVKLADRLHNMETLHHIKNLEKRKRIARETLEIYAPLAERMGMQKLKEQLDDLSFSVLHTEARDSIIHRLQFLREQDNNLIEKIIDGLQKVLHKNNIHAEITGREKTPYSIWCKMQRKNIPFEQLLDIIAFRILVKDIGECYQTLGIIHSQYSVIPGRFKDYISTPKPNNYRSLHTAIIGPERQRIEIQIRSQDMHIINEYGVAAHWQYKQQNDTALLEGRQYRWLRELLDVLENASSPEEFLEHTKLEMFQDQVFCFTPKGEIIALPQGATPVDFAYSVHTQVGDHCVGAKINGRLMPLKTQLKNGDQVEITTSKTQTPSPTWERFAVTAKARACIRRFIRMRQHDQYIELGRTILQKAFRSASLELTEKSLEPVFKKFKCEKLDDLYVMIGEGTHTAKDILLAVNPSLSTSDKNENVISLSTKRKNKFAKENSVPIKGLIPGMALHFAGCCHALPGDRIVGIITTGKGVTIHTIDCETLEKYNDEPERWLDVSWETAALETNVYVGRLILVVNNEPGSLGSLSTVIGRNGGNITNLKITNRSTDFFELVIDIQVKDVRHLTTIIASLRAMSVINSVERAKN
ncbi:MAG: bifunctional (p)ppGpp synthetase/guanosine-3',5'-bis(diphosphate) 3'-pyrophosphohydrolase [Alphaproteobacteria bacterium]|nr:bifunctional (p)ppGpp synthetase/guanosine-3',5'-bis(diphosphate) 3'-pyrophosphohydrolase [Alphaproteobacteria bacterium]